MTSVKNLEVYDAFVTALQTGLRSRIMATTEERARWHVYTKGETPDDTTCWPFVAVDLAADVNPEAQSSRLYRESSNMHVYGCVRITPGVADRTEISRLEYDICAVIAANLCLSGAVQHMIVTKIENRIDTDEGRAWCHVAVRADYLYSGLVPGTA